MPSINLSELLREQPYNGELAHCAKIQDIEGMAVRFAAGVSPVCLFNVLYYHPTLIVDVLEAIDRIAPPLREHALAVLGAMCKRYKGSQGDLYRMWVGRKAALAAIEEIDVQEAA